MENKNLSTEISIEDITTKNLQKFWNLIDDFQSKLKQPLNNKMILLYMNQEFYWKIYNESFNYLNYCLTYDMENFVFANFIYHGLMNHTLCPIVKNSKIILDNSLTEPKIKIADIVCKLNIKC